MATPPKSWFPWLRFKFAVGQWAQSALGLTDEDRGVVWADHGVERPPLPYLALQATSGPTRRGADAEGWPREYPRVVRVAVLPSAYVGPGELANLFVNGELFTHAAAPGDGASDVRDDLLAQVQASVQLGAAAAPDGVDGILLTAADPGTLRAEAALGVSSQVLETQLAYMTTGAREVRVRATAYGADEPEPGAPSVSVAEWIELLAEAANDESSRLALARQGVKLTRTDVLTQRPSGPSGPTIEPRAAADFHFVVEVRRGRAVDAWLDSVVVGVKTV